MHFSAYLVTGMLGLALVQALANTSWAIGFKPPLKGKSHCRLLVLAVLSVPR